MKVSNYEITRNRMRDEFIKYDQEKMIQKFSLKNDRQYLYLDFMGRPYRLRAAKTVWWNGLRTGFTQSLKEISMSP